MRQLARRQISAPLFYIPPGGREQEIPGFPTAGAELVGAPHRFKAAGRDFEQVKFVTGLPSALCAPKLAAGSKFLRSFIGGGEGGFWMARRSVVGELVNVDQIRNSSAVLFELIS